MECWSRCCEDGLLTSLISKPSASERRGMEYWVLKLFYQVICSHNMTMGGQWCFASMEGKKGLLDFTLYIIISLATYVSLAANCHLSFRINHLRQRQCEFVSSCAWTSEFCSCTANLCIPFSLSISCVFPLLCCGFPVCVYGCTLVPLQCQLCLNWHWLPNSFYPSWIRSFLVHALMLGDGETSVKQHQHDSDLFPQ